MSEVPSEPRYVPLIDLEDSDDDVIESSPRSFAQASARRNRRRMGTGSNLGSQTIPTYAMHTREQRIFEPIGDVYINLEVNTGGEAKNAKISVETKKEAYKSMIEEPEPPEEPRCPICMDSFVEEMTTRCGHIFCKNCIKNVIRIQGKCPTCRKKVTSRQLIKVFLPSFG